MNALLRAQAPCDMRRRGHHSNESPPGDIVKTIPSLSRRAAAGRLEGGLKHRIWVLDLRVRGRVRRVCADRVDVCGESGGIQFERSLSLAPALP